MNEERESFGEEGEIIMKNTSTIFWRENKVEYRVAWNRINSIIVRQLD